jgi:hypothetical protein
MATLRKDVQTVSVSSKKGLIAVFSLVVIILTVFSKIKASMNHLLEYRLINAVEIYYAQEIGYAVMIILVFGVIIPKIVQL